MHPVIVMTFLVSEMYQGAMGWKTKTCAVYLSSIHSLQVFLDFSMVMLLTRT
jgi:hypothetical protein